ncbi:MAG: hypothetical protein AAF851_16955 [Myxococcota bacterium]
MTGSSRADGSSRAHFDQLSREVIDRHTKWLPFYTQYKRDKRRKGF